MDEVMWTTFESKANELLSCGYALSFQLQVRAVSIVDQKLTQWKLDLRQHHNYANNSSEIEHEHTTEIRKDSENCEDPDDGSMLENSEFIDNLDHTPDIVEQTALEKVSAKSEMFGDKCKDVTATSNQCDMQSTSDVCNRSANFGEDPSKNGSEHSSPKELQKLARTNEQSRTFHCKTCGVHFKTRSLFNIHRRDQKNCKLECEICDKKFIQLSTFTSHMLVHKHGALKCDTCDKEYKTLGGLNIHKKMHNPTSACSHCDYRAPTPSYLKKHIDRTHFKHDVSRNRHICEKCGMRFYRKSQLGCHMITHTDVKNYSCPHCDHCTKTKILLNAHITNMHTVTDPFVCNICGATTKFKESMDQHQRRHRNDKPYKCDMCPYASVSSSHLTQHKRTHTGPGFQCEVCEKKFLTRGHLKRHQVIHTGQKDFLCTQCKYSCNEPSNLKKHMRHVHKL